MPQSSNMSKRSRRSAGDGVPLLPHGRELRVEDRRVLAVPAHRHDLAVCGCARGAASRSGRGARPSRPGEISSPRYVAARRLADLAAVRLRRGAHLVLRSRTWPIATTAFTRSGCGMYASSSRRRYADLPLVEEHDAGQRRQRPSARARPSLARRRRRTRIGVEGRELGLRALDQLERRLGDDAERALVAHEQVLELVAGRRLADLPAAAVADADDLAGREHDLEADDEVARVAVAAADQRPAARPDAPADERARVRAPGCPDR